MSGIAGIFSFGGKPAEAAVVHAMTDAVAHRGPDAGACWIKGTVGLGQRATAGFGEALAQPRLGDLDEDLRVVLDGRLDNRDELLCALRLPAQAALSDAQLLMCAYRAWHEDLPRRLLGDFAFAIWDGRRRSLFCARDVLGIRPLCYFLGRGRFTFGSEMHQLFLDTAVSSAPNEGMIGEYLAWSIASADETLFKDVRRLPPAHCLAIEMGGKMRCWRYWDVDFGARIRHPNADDYARQLRELLTQCVRSRLPASGPVGSHLSGGLDSSTVTVLAHELLRARGDSRGIEAYSVTYPGLPCDESRHVEALARQVGLRVHLLAHRECEEAAFAERAARTRDFPGYPMSNALMGSVCAAARAGDCRVLLTGEGGDELLGGDADNLADLIGEFRYRDTWREVRALGSQDGSSAASVLLRHGIKPWMRRVAHRLGPFGRRRADLSWLSSTWAARIQLRERIVPPSLPEGGASCAQRAAYCATFSAHNTHFYEAIDLFGFGAGIEYRHPLLDRRLIEFAYAVPQELHFRGGRRKGLMREAMRGLIPETTLEPGSSVDYAAVVVSALEGILRKSPVADWPVARAGWVRPALLETAYRESRANLLAGSPWRGRPIWNLWMAYGVGVTLDAARARSISI